MCSKYSPLNIICFSGRNGGGGGGGGGGGEHCDSVMYDSYGYFRLAFSCLSTTCIADNEQEKVFIY